MKTNGAQEKRLTENDINCRLQHKNFVEVSAKKSCIKTKNWFGKSTRAAMGFWLCWASKIILVN